jgi:hypothetical protein
MDIMDIIVEERVCEFCTSGISGIYGPWCSACACWGSISYEKFCELAKVFCKNFTICHEQIFDTCKWHVTIDYCDRCDLNRLELLAQSQRFENICKDLSFEHTGLKHPQISCILDEQWKRFMEIDKY